MFRVKPKVRLAFIENESARRETFRKRRKGLLKKIQELSVLCDVEACGVVYSPYAEEPEVWPSAAEARRLVAVLGELPETDYVTRKFTHKTYLQDRLAKVEEQLEKENREVKEREKSKVMHHHVGNIVLRGTTRFEELDELSSKDLKDLVSLVDKKLREIDHRERRKSITGLPPPEKPATATDIAAAGGGSGIGSSAQQTNIVTCSDDDFNFWPENNYSLADLFPPSS